MPVHLSVVVSLAQIVGVLAAIIGLAVQIKRSRFSLSVELTLRLDDKFNSERFEAKRRKAAASIQENRFDQVDDVLDFFETLGMLVRRNAINKEMVWHTFFHWMHGYWLTCSGYIAEKRRENSSTWQDFRYLHQEICELEKRKNNLGDSDLSWPPGELKQFLLDEIDNGPS